ncbi:MAG: DedA family protein [Deltaproteobacteria bacterium]|nr:DedA family protein [Deltaproteobacteria bacterium]MBW2266355.1 DedA family protein [Deltaproteobacteria bacterium]MBW2317845.1 DedA family protein [Deltaproteobacteria bacterium]MBW2600586.1 DedA family protein [Deltaproteobacteria bacterium]OEU46645.1 MAG: cytochrome B [Desulfobacterales bacterium S7086C20]
MLRRLYDWVLHWAKTPYGTWALFILAFCESSFFPIPPDVLLIAVCVAVPTRSFKYAMVCSVGSVLGGCLGYFIGWQFMVSIGEAIIRFYGLHDKYEYIQQLYKTYDAWAVGIAGLTPIPYKVFTITAGAFHINFMVFLIASAVSRSARFFVVGGLIYMFGSKIQSFIERRFNILAVLFVILLILGFVVIKYIF